MGDGLRLGPFERGGRHFRLETRKPLRVGRQLQRGHGVCLHVLDRRYEPLLPATEAALDPVFDRAYLMRALIVPDTAGAFLHFERKSVARQHTVDQVEQAIKGGVHDRSARSKSATGVFPSVPSSAPTSTSTSRTAR